MSDNLDGKPIDIDLIVRELNFQMAVEHACRLRVGIDVPDRFNTSYVDALCVESL